MKAITLEQAEAYQYAQLKRDGMSIRVDVDQFGRWVAETTTPADVTPRIRALTPSEGQRFAALPPDTVVWCELFVPGRRASHVKTALKEDPRSCRLEAWYVERWAGSALSDIAHCEMLIRSTGLKWVPYGLRSSMLESMRTGCWRGSRGLPLDSEGWVFKNGNEPGVKWKPEPTIDLIVRDVVWATGATHLGLIGSLVCHTVEGHHLANAGGLKRADRVHFTELALDGGLDGVVVEVKYQYLNERGHLRHPRFVRIRDDKQHAECSIHQDVEVLTHYEEISDG